MAFVPIEYLQARTTSFTSNVATAITTDSTTTALLLSLLGTSGNFTTVAVTDGLNYEIMNLTGVVSGAVTVERAQEGTTAVPLASGATIRFIWTVASIQAIAGGGTAVTLTGSGQAAVTGGPDYNVDVPTPSLVGASGITVTGTYPSLTFASTVPSGPQGATGPAGPAVVVTASGIAVASGGPATYNVAVPATNVQAGSGITVTGSGTSGDPYIIVNAQTQGGTGTVTSLVGGTGITIGGGTPTINPTVSITPTGIGAGTYGGITVDATGRISAIASGFVTNISTSTTGMTVATPTVGNYTVNTGTASTGTQGLVKLAPSTSGGSNDPSNHSDAVTPAGVNAVVAGLVITPATLAVSGVQNAISSALYTNVISGMPISVTVAAGKQALVDIYVEVVDPSNPTVDQTFAIGLFNGASFLTGNGPVIGCTRNLKYLITGPLTATLSVATIALTGTQVLGSYYASVIGN